MPDVLPPGGTVEASAPEPQSEEDYTHYLPQEEWDQVVAEAPMHATDPKEVDWREAEDLTEDEATAEVEEEGLLIDPELDDGEHHDLVLNPEDAD
jgi:hypothetical protein